MKIYDKEMYQKEQWIKSTLLVVGVFIVGFIVGYFVHSFEKQETINALEQNVYEMQQELLVTE